MNNLETSIKVFSAIFTDTTDDMGEVLRNIDNFEINKLNSVSLYEIILAFNYYHNAFIKEYDALDKLDLGKRVDIDNFEIKNDDGNKYRKFMIQQ